MEISYLKFVSHYELSEKEHKHCVPITLFKK